jgi:hypothetical protein
MSQAAKTRTFFQGLWRTEVGSFTALNTLELVLNPGARLPLSFWRDNFRFAGARDDTLQEVTEGRFPVKIEDGKTHPLHTLEKLPGAVGFTVCPCSSKKPFGVKRYRYIKVGCELLHTGVVIDRNSYLVEGATFNIPASMARELRFQGEVPAACCLSQGNLSDVDEGSEAS